MSTSHASSSSTSSSNVAGSSHLITTSSSSLGNNTNSNIPTTSTPERRAELLRHARKSRLQWILQGLDQDRMKYSIKHPSSDLYRKIPAAECLQQVINFLTNIIDDGEMINIEALVPPEGLDEDFDEKVPIPSYENFTSGGGNQSVDYYLLFIEKLKHPLAIEIVKLLQQFITKIEITMRLEQQKLPPTSSSSSSSYSSSSFHTSVGSSQSQDIDDKISKDIWAFLKQMNGIMKDNLLWKSETTEQWNTSMISCEKFLFIKLYDCLFGNDIQLLEQDERIHERIESLSFLSPDHLDMKSLQYEWTRRRTHSEEALDSAAAAAAAGSGLMNSQVKPNDINEITIGSAVKRLRNISLARCPTDKLQCLKEVSQMVIQILTTSRKQAGRTSLPGADDFLPALILIIKEANPAHLHSTTAYIQRYTHPSRLVSEAGYILTHFVSAIHFLETVDATALTISPLEYEMCIAQSKAKKREKEQEWGKRADELRDYREREMISKEDGHIISVSEYKRNEQEYLRNQAIRQNESNQLQQIYSSLREERKKNRLGCSLPLPPLPPPQSSIQGEPTPRPLSGDSRLQLKNLLLERLKTSNGSQQQRQQQQQVLESWNKERVVNYYYRSIDTLSLHEIHQLHSEYRSLAQACASLIGQGSGNK